MIQNPYKHGHTRPALTHLQCDVKTTDWDVIYRCYPYRGTQDNILSMFIHKLAIEVRKQQIHTLPHEQQEQSLEQLIRGCSFPSINGHGHLEDEQKPVGSLLRDTNQTPSRPSRKTRSENAREEKN